MEDLFRRKKNLENARVELKKEFVGINDQIDNIIELVYSWYCFPNGQTRPTVINLFGMTGVGKTSLVERLFDLIDLDKSVFKFDMGYYASKGENLKTELSKKVKSYDGNPICFVLDEFQLCRSIAEDGSEIDRGNFRPIWDLLDHGKISILDNDYGIEALNLLSMKIDYSIKNGVRSKGRSIISGEKMWTDIMGYEGYDEDEDEDENDTNDPKNKKITIKELKLVPSQFFYYVKNCLPNKFISSSEVGRYIDSLKSHLEISSFIKEAVATGARPKVFDFSNSIIFVIANLDEAFVDSDDSDPDMDADVFHKRSLEIGLFDIKESLGERFRTEQVSRLGNNIIIYPAFDSKAYKDLIALELEKKKKIFKAKFELDIVFDDTVNDIIYKEGVFPTHGARPVFTTINYIIDSFVGRAMVFIYENDTERKAANIFWEFKNNINKISVNSIDSEKPMLFIEFPVNIKVESLRKPKRDDEQASTSVHEAGHAIVAASCLGELPTKIISASAGAAEGFNLFNWKKLKSHQYTIDMACVYLAGIEAEKLIFGKPNAGASGAMGDLKAATAIINSMVMGSGLYTPHVSHWEPASGSMKEVKDFDDRTIRGVQDVLKKAKDKACVVLEKHKKALLALSLALFETPTMYKEDVRKILTDNGLPVVDKSEGFYVNKLLSFSEEKKNSTE